MFNPSCLTPSTTSSDQTRHPRQFRPIHWPAGLHPPSSSLGVDPWSDSWSRWPP